MGSPRNPLRLLVAIGLVAATAGGGWFVVRARPGGPLPCARNDGPHAFEYALAEQREGVGMDQALLDAAPLEVSAREALVTF